MRWYVPPLLVSLALDVWLLHERWTAEETPAVAPPAAPAPTARTATRIVVPPAIANLPRPELDARIVAAEARLEKLLPLNEKFELAEPSPASEQRMRAILDARLHVPYTVECHALVCRIETDMMELQHVLVGEDQLGGDGISVGVPASYVQLVEPSVARGR